MNCVDEEWINAKGVLIDRLYREAGRDPSLIARLIPHLLELHRVLPTDQKDRRLYVAGLLGSAFVGAALSGDTQKAREAIPFLCEAISIASSEKRQRQLGAAARMLMRASLLDTEWLEVFRHRDVEALVETDPFVRRAQRELNWRMAKIGSRKASEYELAQIRELEVSISFWKDRRRTLTSHDQAIKVLSDSLELGKPFVLYLRSFRLETINSIRNEGPDGPVISTSFRQDPMEDKLASFLTQYFPMIGLCNATDVMRRSKVLKIEVRDDEWELIAFALICCASFIIMAVESITSGVIIETELIRTIGCQDSTIVVLPKKYKTDVLDELVGDMFGPDILSTIPPITRKEWTKQFSDFTRVVEEDEILRESPEWLRCFKGLVPA